MMLTRALPVAATPAGAATSAVAATPAVAPLPVAALPVAWKPSMNLVGEAQRKASDLLRFDHLKTIDPGHVVHMETMDFVHDLLLAAIVLSVGSSQQTPHPWSQGGCVALVVVPKWR